MGNGPHLTRDGCVERAVNKPQRFCGLLLSHYNLVCPDNTKPVNSTIIDSVKARHFQEMVVSSWVTLLEQVSDSEREIQGKVTCNHN
jgi:hypothetical protein